MRACSMVRWLLSAASRAFVVLALAAALPLLSPTAFATTYQITELGNLPGFRSAIPTDINSEGTVAGYLTTPDASSAFVWDSHSGMRSIAGSTDYSVAEAVNDAGQVVGYAYVAGSGPRAFVWDTTAGFRYLNIPGASQSYALDINNRGDVVGHLLYPQTAFVYTDGTATLLSRPDLEALYARAINESRTIAGEAGYTHIFGAYVWDYATPAGFAAIDGTAVDINEAGQIACNLSSYISRDYSAVFDAQGNLVHYLAYMPGCNAARVESINDDGYCVGESWGGGTGYACVWDPSGQVQSLPTPYSGGTQAWGINNGGQIVGYGLDAEGRAHGLLWTPVPEPSSLLALLCGGSGLALLRRKR